MRSTSRLSLNFEASNTRMNIKWSQSQRYSLWKMRTETAVSASALATIVVRSVSSSQRWNACARIVIPFDFQCISDYVSCYGVFFDRQSSSKWQHHNDVSTKSMCYLLLFDLTSWNEWERLWLDGQTCEVRAPCGRTQTLAAMTKSKIEIFLLQHVQMSKKKKKKKRAQFICIDLLLLRSLCRLAVLSFRLIVFRQIDSLQFASAKDNAFVKINMHGVAPKCDAQIFNRRATRSLYL